MYCEGAFAIPLGRFAQKHVTYPQEILWFAGGPGARVGACITAGATSSVLRNKLHRMVLLKCLHDRYQKSMNCTGESRNFFVADAYLFSDVLL